MKLKPTQLIKLTQETHFMKRSSRCETRYSLGTNVCSQAVMEGKQLTENDRPTKVCSTLSTLRGEKEGGIGMYEIGHFDQ